MKILKQCEVYLRNIRNKFFKYIFDSKKGRKLHLKGMSDDVIFITKQFLDHKITFIPHEWIGSSLYIKGHYDRDIFDIVVKLLKKYSLIQENKMAIELGANIGTHSIYMHLSKLFSHLYCVEADLDMCNMLRKNLSQNDLLKKSTIISDAINDYDGSVKLYKRMNEYNLGYQSILNLENSTNFKEVNCCTLKTIIKNYEIDINKIGFIWIDLEGIEFNILKQINQIFHNSIPIFLEFSPYIYGKKITEKFILYIKSKYKYCFLIQNKNYTLIKLDKNESIPKNFDQADLLLFN